MTNTRLAQLAAVLRGFQQSALAGEPTNPDDLEHQLNAVLAGPAVLPADQLPEPGSTGNTYRGQPATGPAQSSAANVGQTEVSAAIGAAAHNVYRSDPDVDYSEWLTAEDEKVCPICVANQEAGPVPIGAPFPSGVPFPPAHVNCLPGDALVSARSRITGATSRIYDGELVCIRTLADKLLSVTPNHPVLTDHGWIAAGLLKKGENVVSASESERKPGIDYDNENMPARIQQIAEAFLCSRNVTTAEVPLTAEDFHGDGAGSEVSIIGTYRSLRPVLKTERVQVGGKQPFQCGHMYIARRGFTGLRSSDSPFQRVGISTPSHVSSNSKSATLFGSSLRHADVHAFATPSGLDVVLQQDAADNVTTDAKRFSKRFFALTLGVAVEQVAEVWRVPFSGHVYNLETVDGWYIANGIVTHNCRCTTTPSDYRAVPAFEAQQEAMPMRRFGLPHTSASRERELQNVPSETTVLHVTAELEKGAPEGNISGVTFGPLAKCVSCGCGLPHDDHGDARNITQEDVEAAGAAVGIAPGQAASNIADAWRAMMVDEAGARQADQASKGWHDAWLHELRGGHGEWIGVGGDVPHFAQHGSTHVEVKPLVNGDHEDIKQRVGNQLNHQAQWVPNLAVSYHAHVTPDNEPDSGHHQWGSIVIRQHELSDDQLPHTVAHQMGHAVHDAFQGGAATQYNSKLGDINLWRKLSAALGVKDPPFTPRSHGRGYVTPMVSTDWVRRNRAAIRDQVSNQATANVDEFIAELWDQFTTSPNPSPVAQIFGDYVMQNLPSRTHNPLLGELAMAGGSVGGRRKSMQDYWIAKDLRTAWEHELRDRHGKWAKAVTEALKTAPDAHVASADRNAEHVVFTIGDPKTADHVVTIVPGMNPHWEHLPAETKAASRMKAAVEARTGKKVAAILWAGYKPPQNFASASDKLTAQHAAKDLMRFQRQLRKDNPNAHRTVIGHSYGSVVSGEAARHLPNFADDLVLIGSPGTSAHKATEFNVPDGHVWVGAHSKDPVAGVSRELRFHYGGSPARPAFGAKVFNSEVPGAQFSTPLHSSVGVLGRMWPQTSEADPVAMSAGAHSSYWRPNSNAWNAMTAIASGDPIIETPGIPGQPLVVKGWHDAWLHEFRDPRGHWVHEGPPPAVQDMVKHGWTFHGTPGSHQHASFLSSAADLMRSQPQLRPLAETLRRASAEMNKKHPDVAHQVLLGAAKQTHFAALKTGDVNLRHAAFALHYHGDLLDDLHLTGRSDLPETREAADARRSLEADLKSGQHDVQYPGHGQMGETSFVRFNNGSRWVRKGDAAIDQDREILSSRVADALGARAPEVIPDSSWNPTDKHPVVWEPMLPHPTAIDLERGKDYDPDKVFSGPEGQRIGVLDKIISNQDRNDGNWLVDSNGLPVPIDHGQAYFDNDYAPSSEFSTKLDPTSISPAQWDEWAGKLGALSPEFSALNRGDWFQSMMQSFQSLRPS